jgi:hypothetical protein
MVDGKGCGWVGLGGCQWGVDGRDAIFDRARRVNANLLYPRGVRMKYSAVQWVPEWMDKGKGDLSDE